MTLEALDKEIARLDEKDQLDLARSVLYRLSPGGVQLSTNQINEIDRRLEELNNGSVAAIPAQRVIAALKAKYGTAS